MSRHSSGLEADIDALFALPLAEFTAARNALAARLKQAGRGGEAERVKAMVKPSISAWAVNQLYWNHRESFDRLIAAGQQFRQVHELQATGMLGDMREPGDARRRALSDLSRLAAALLREAGHNPTSDIMRRITTTLEAMSAYASLPGAPPPGRLTEDVDPPGFEALAALIAGGKLPEPAKEPTRVSPFLKSRRSESPLGTVRELEEKRQTRIAEAKVSLRDAEDVLKAAQTRAQSAAATLKKAVADAKEAGKQMLEAEERFKKASAASQEAGRRAHSAEVVTQETAKAVEDATRAVEQASGELQSLLREPPGTGKEHKKHKTEHKKHKNGPPW